MAEIDYHIEISTLVEFINDQIKSSTLIPISGAEIFKHIRRAVLDSETKPFLSNPPEEEEINYYKNCLERLKEVDPKYITDFFESDGDLYDLCRPLNISKESTNRKTFAILFSLKILEVKSKNLPINDFLCFQLFDNFYGDKESFDDFLRELIAIDGNSYLFSSNFDEEIEKWIGKESASIVDAPVETHKTKKNPDAEKEDIEFKKYLESRKGFKIPGKLTDEQTQHFFSFLYKEKSVNKEPFLAEESFNKIFANGLLIPQEIPVEKFSLNTSLKFPKKIIDYAIHTFFLRHSLTERNKQDFVLFFAIYFIEYEKALNSKKELNNITSNMSGEKSTKTNISWETYLPKT
jgi:hypothetical protein